MERCQGEQVLKRILAVLMSVMLVVCGFVYMPKALANENVAGEEDSLIVKVTDKQGTAIPGATVIIETPNGEARDEVITDNNGLARLTNIYAYCADTLGWKEVEEPTTSSEPTTPSLTDEELAQLEKEKEEADKALFLDLKYSMSIDNGLRYKDKTDVCTIYKVGDNRPTFNGTLSLSMDNQYYAKGVVKMKDYKDKDSQADTFVENAKITLNNEKTTTNKNGEYSYDKIIKIEDANKTTIEDTDVYVGGEYDLTYTKDGATAIVEKRFAPKFETHYAYGAGISDNGYVPKAGEYTVKSVNGCTYSSDRKGEFKDTYKFTIDEKGKCSPFVVKNAKGEISLKTGNIVKIDSANPKVNKVVSIKDIKGNNINFLNFEMAAKSSADLKIVLSLSDADSGIDVSKTVLVGTDESGDTEYKCKAASLSGDTASMTFNIPSNKKTLFKQTFSVKTYDKVGNMSNVKLVRGIGKSMLIVEREAPKVSSFVATGKLSPYGWYSTPVSVRIETNDAGSGINNIKSVVNNQVFENNTRSFAGKYYGTDEGGKSSDIHKTNSTTTVGISAGKVSELMTDAGTYKVVFAAEDNAGNKIEKSKTYKIDLVKPVVSLSGINQDKQYKNVPSLNISNSEKHYSQRGAKITATIYRNGSVATEKNYARANSATVSAFSLDGNYKVVANAVDAAGNKSRNVSTKFIVDRTAPLISITGAKEGSFNAKAKTINISVKEENYKTDVVKIAVSRTLEGKTSHIAFPWSNKGKVSVSSKTFSAPGTYKITVTAKDNAGNTAQTKTLKFTVDNKKPTIKIEGVTDKTYSKSEVVAPKIIIKDSYFKSKKITLTAANEADVSKFTHEDKMGQYGGSVQYRNFISNANFDDIYTLTATAEDKAGNTETKKVTFSVNRYGSTFNYNKVLRSLNGSYVKTIGGLPEITEKNISNLDSSIIELKRDGQEVANPSVSKKAKGNDKNGYTWFYTFAKENFTPEGVYTINIVSKDKSGNMVESSKKAGKVWFAVDKTPPVITVQGLEKKIYDTARVAVTVTAKDSIAPTTLDVTVNDEPVKYTVKNGKRVNEAVVEFEMTEGVNQKVEMIARDKTGNESIKKIEGITISTSAFVRFYSNKYMFSAAVAGGLLLGCIAVLIFILRRKKKKPESVEESDDVFADFDAENEDIKEKEDFDIKE